MEGVAAAFAVLFTLAGIIWGVVCLVSPKAARLPSRWYSLPLLLSLCLFFGLLMVAFPESNSDTPSGDIRGVGFSFVLIWVVLAAVCHMAARNMPKIRAAVKEAQKASNTEHIDAVERERDFNARRAAEAMIRRNTHRDDWDDYDDEDYEPTPRRKRRKRVAPKVQGDLKNIPAANSGTAIEFTYVDAQGEITDRHLRNWSRDQEYLKGYCMDRKASRTFRIDRVIHWGASE